MVQTVNTFVDSSVLVEYIKDKKTALLDYLINHQRDLAINSTVISEFLFYFLGYRGNKSPMTLKRNSSIASIIDQYDPVSILTGFTVLSETKDVFLVTFLMQKHNLLPNDALILATCLHHSIPYLASYDVTDFQPACAAEDLTLISNIEEAQQLLA